MRTRRIMNNLPVFKIAGIGDFAERLAVRVVNHRIIEFAAHDKVNVGTGQQALGRLDLHVRPHKRNLDARLPFFDCARKLEIALKSNRRREHHEEIVVTGDVNGLLRRDLMRRRIEQAASRQHSRRISKPDRIPIGLDLSSCRPAGTCAAVKILEARRVEQKCLHYRRHSTSSWNTMALLLLCFSRFYLNFQPATKKPFTIVVSDGTLAQADPWRSANSTALFRGPDQHPKTRDISGSPQRVPVRVARESPAPD